jgi:WD40 repeat protein
MPPPLDRVVERSELGSQLLTMLTESTPPHDGGLIVGVRGAGGYGKTVLATWACHQQAIDRHFPGGLLWVTVGQEAHGVDLADKINDVAFVLSGERPAIANPDAAGAELGRLLGEREPVLLVIDDVWSGAQLRPFRYGAPECTRLVTTRIDGLLPDGAPQLMVDAMSVTQARALVGGGIEGLPATQADRLATTAGRWPVLLNVINGTLRRRIARGDSLDEAAAAVEQRIAQHGPAALDPSRPDGRGLAVAATVDASLSLLPPQEQERFVDLALFPEDVDIPLGVLKLLWPDTDVDSLCEDLFSLGLVAELRLGPPGPRMVLHDVMRAYLIGRRARSDWIAAHRRMVAAASVLLNVHDNRHDDQDPAPWWDLPPDADYLWRYLPHHLRQADQPDDLATLVCDLRWIEAKTQRFGSVVAAESDLVLVETPVAEALRRTLREAAHLLGPIDTPGALGATLASRLHGVPDLDATLARYRATLPRPRLAPDWPPPGQGTDNEVAAKPNQSGHTGSVTSCTFSPDGTLIATTGDDAGVVLWQLTDHTRRRRVTGHTAAVWDADFSPDGALLVTASADHTARIWRVADASARAILDHDDEVTSCAFSPDGNLVATTCGNGTVRLWNVATQKPVLQLTAHADVINDCAFSPDGAVLATASNDNSARLWDVTTGNLVTTFTGHDHQVMSCTFSPNGSLLATTGNDATARLWDLATGSARILAIESSRRVRRCAFSPDGATLATVGSDAKARIWDVATGSLLSELTGHTAGAHGCAISPDGSRLATTSNDQTLRVWRLADGTQESVLSGRDPRVSLCRFSPDGTLLATTSFDGTARLWDVATRTTRTLIAAHDGAVRGCAFSPDGTLLATSGTDSRVRLWHTADGSPKAVLTGHTGWGRGCTFSPNGSVLATAGYDATIRLWNVVDGTTRRVIVGHTDRVNGCAFSPDGHLLVSASDDKTMKIWTVDDGAQLGTLVGHTDLVNSCRFSPDGHLLASASDDGTVRLWRLSDRSQLAVLKGHTSSVNSCRFTPDGTLLATTSHDGTIRLWQLPAGEPHCTLRVAGPLVALHWHPNGHTLAAVGGAGIHVLVYEP